MYQENNIKIRKEKKKIEGRIAKKQNSCQGEESIKLHKQKIYAYIHIK